MKLKIPAIPHTLIEFLLVTFSVLLALMLNEWRSTYKENRQTERVLQAVLEELKANRMVLDEWHENHSMIMNNTWRLINSSPDVDTLYTEQGFRFHLVQPRGLFQSILREDAWEAAKLTQATANMSTEQITLLSRIYSLQLAGLQTTTRKAIDAIYDPDFILNKDNFSNSIMLYFVFIREMISQEETLMREYDTTIDKIENSR